MASSTGPDIVTDGLQVALDATNAKSYPGTGTTWYDLSGNNYIGSMSNVFEITNLMYFDRNGQGIVTMTGPNIAGTTNYSMMMFIAISSGMSGNDCRFFWHGGYGVLVYKAADDVLRLYIRNSTPTVLQIGTDISSYLFPTVKWMCIAATYDGSTMKLYLNGELKDSGAHSGGIVNASANLVNIGGNPDNSSFFTSCYIGNVYIYNRALTDVEVTNNYNATKSRFFIVPPFLSIDPSP